VLVLQFYLDLYNKSLSNRFYRIDPVLLERLSVPRTVSVKSDLLGFLELSSVMSDLLLNQSNMKILIGKRCLRFYWHV
jgi:hypothetical protein